MAEEVADVGKLRGSSSKTLDENVREIEVGGLGQVFGQHVFDLERIFQDFRHRRGCCGREGRNEEDLDDLEDKVGMLDEQLDQGMRRYTSNPRASYQTVSLCCEAMEGESMLTP